MKPLSSERFELVHPLRAETGDAPATLATDVRRGLAKAPRSVPPKYFYDAEGSALFDAICELPEYYVTRAEHALLVQHAGEIVERVRPAELVELGSGMARKTGLLIDAMQSRVASPIYVPLDISPDALEASAKGLLAAHPTLRVRAIVGDFQRDLGDVRASAPKARRLFAFLGSTMGNLDETEAPALVARVAKEMDEGDAFLLGVDLVKDARVLHAAYNDAAGVTARFNKNILAVVNKELHADFDLASWEHEAAYVTSRARIEMHLRATRAHEVTLAKLGMTIAIADGERILTEISRKFTRASVESTLSAGGMTPFAWYSGDDAAFALVLARRA